MRIDVKDIHNGYNDSKRITTFQMDESDWKWLTVHCLDKGLSKSHVLRKLIAQFRRQVEGGQ